MKSSEKVLWICRTAVFLALLVVMQAATAPFGMTLITGSVVNLILIISVMTCGFLSGATIAVVSPFFAKLLGIGPLWPLLPLIALGNTVLVLIWHIVGRRKYANMYIPYGMALVIGAVCKFLTLYITITRLAVPFLLNLPEKQATVISNTFSIPQLVTASIGGALATIMLPMITKALKHDIINR